MCVRIGFANGRAFAMYRSMRWSFFLARGAPPPLGLARRLRASLGPLALLPIHSPPRRIGDDVVVEPDEPVQLALEDALLIAVAPKPFGPSSLSIAGPIPQHRIPFARRYAMSVIGNLSSSLTPGGGLSQWVAGYSRA
jgi:hypothetical protein